MHAALAGSVPAGDVVIPARWAQPHNQRYIRPLQTTKLFYYAGKQGRVARTQCGEWTRRWRGTSAPGVGCVGRWGRREQSRGAIVVGRRPAPHD